MLSLGQTTRPTSHRMADLVQNQERKNRGAVVQAQKIKPITAWRRSSAFPIICGGGRLARSLKQSIQVIYMASENDIYREAVRREHRSFAMQLAVRALASRVQCVAFAYEDLKIVFGLSSLRDARVDWICHDILPWFPFWITEADRCVRPGRLPLFLSSIELPNFDAEPPLPELLSIVVF